MVVRLVDKVVNAPPMVELVDERGGSHRLHAVGYRAEAIRECPVRYILDEHVSRECISLILQPNDDLLAPESELLRLPATDFWIEWLGMRGIDAQPKVGALVQSSDDGLSGRIIGYWEDELGRAATTGATIYFDLSRPQRNRDPLGGVTFRHGSHRHLDSLLGTARLEIDPAWTRFLRAGPGGFDGALSALAGANWYYLPLTCAFAAMLNSNGLLEQQPSQLERLNAARLRRGRSALLDHIEVSINLGDGRSLTGARGSQPGRSSPRLHYVRGHFVQRAGRFFWRSPHLRGDASRPILGKTINVRNRRPPNAILANAKRSIGERGSTALVAAQ